MDGSRDPRATLLDAWRARGADRVDLLRFHRIEALQRRAAALDGEARRLLDDRLAALVEAYAGAVRDADARASERAAAVPAGTGLGELLDRLAGRGTATGPAATTDIATPSSAVDKDRDDRAEASIDPAPDAAETSAQAALPGVADAAGATPQRDLDAVHDLRRIWSRVRTRSQLRRSLRQAPDNAGPLNSGSLVHRALTLMQRASPGYLEHFMAYVDALSCLERMDGGSTGTEAPAPASGGRPGGRVRARKRKA